MPELQVVGPGDTPDTVRVIINGVEQQLPRSMIEQFTPGLLAQEPAPPPVIPGFPASVSGPALAELQKPVKEVRLPLGSGAQVTPEQILEMEPDVVTRNLPLIDPYPKAPKPSMRTAADEARVTREHAMLEARRTSEEAERASEEAVRAANVEISAQAAAKQRAAEKAIQIEEQTERDLQATRAARDRFVQSALFDADEIQRQIDEGEIDRTRVFKNMSTFGRILAVIGGAIGGYLALYSKDGRNQFMETLEKIIDDDIGAQLEDRKAKERKLERAYNYIDSLKDRFQDDEAARLSAKASMLGVAQQALNIELEKVAQNEGAVARGAAARAALAQGRQQATIEAGKREADARGQTFAEETTIKSAQLQAAQLAEEHRQATKREELERDRLKLERDKFEASKGPAPVDELRQLRIQELQTKLDEEKRDRVSINAFTGEEEGNVVGDASVRQEWRNRELASERLTIGAAAILRDMREIGWVYQGPFKDFVNTEEGRALLSRHGNFLMDLVVLESGKQFSGGEVQRREEALALDRLSNFFSGSYEKSWENFIDYLAAKRRGNAIQAGLGTTVADKRYAEVARFKDLGVPEDKGLTLDTAVKYLESPEPSTVLAGVEALRGKFKRLEITKEQHPKITAEVMAAYSKMQPVNIQGGKAYQELVMKRKEEAFGRLLKTISWYSEFRSQEEIDYYRKVIK